MISCNRKLIRSYVNLYIRNQSKRTLIERTLSLYKGTLFKIIMFTSPHGRPGRRDITLFLLLFLMQSLAGMYIAISFRHLLGYAIFFRHSFGNMQSLSEFICFVIYSMSELRGYSRIILGGRCKICNSRHVLATLA